MRRSPSCSRATRTRIRHAVVVTALLTAAAVAPAAAREEPPEPHAPAGPRDVGEPGLFTPGGQGLWQDAGARRWSFLDVDARGRPYRWDPCRPLRYRIALNGVSPTEGRRVRGAMTTLGRALGVRTVYRGTIRWVPDTTQVPSTLGVDVVVAFAAPGDGVGRSSMIRLGEAGRAGYDLAGGLRRDPTTPGLVVPRIEGGVAVISTERLHTFTGAMRRALYLHELAHVVNLGHGAGAAQVMHLGLLRDPPADYSRDDRAGLARLGRRAGCLTEPTVAGAPEVVVDGSRIVVTARGARSRSGLLRYRPLLRVDGLQSAGSGSTTHRTRAIDWTSLVTPALFVEDRTRRLRASMLVRNDAAAVGTPWVDVDLPPVEYGEVRPALQFEAGTVRLPRVPAYYGGTDEVAGARSRATVGEVALTLHHADGSVGHATLTDGTALFLVGAVTSIEAEGTIVYGGAEEPLRVDYGGVYASVAEGRSSPSATRE